MAITITELIVSEEINAATDVADIMIPANNTIVWINCFHGDAIFTTNSYCAIIWKYDHATESEIIIWSTKGSSKMPLKKKITDTDGIRKLAVLCSNGEAGAVVMSAYARIKVIT